MHTHNALNGYRGVQKLRTFLSVQPLERLAKAAVRVILALSLVAARADFLWIGNSPLLNYSAGKNRRKQAVWLRRILLLEVTSRQLDSCLYGASNLRAGLFDLSLDLQLCSSNCSVRLSADSHSTWQQAANEVAHCLACVMFEHGHCSRLVCQRNMLLCPSDVSVCNTHLSINELHMVSIIEWASEP